MRMIKRVITMTVLALTVFGVSVQADITSDMVTARNLYGVGDYTSAIAAYEQVKLDYADGDVRDLFTCQIMIGYSYHNQAKRVEAQAAFEIAAAVTNWPPENSMARVAVARQMLSEQLFLQGDKAGAALEAVKASLDYGFVSLSHQEKCMEVISVKSLGRANSIVYLTDLLLMATDQLDPITESEAIFLGKVKTKLNVLN